MFIRGSEHRAHGLNKIRITQWNIPGCRRARCLDVTRAKESIGFTAGTTLEDGLATTIERLEDQKGHVTERALAAA